MIEDLKLGGQTFRASYFFLSLLALRLTFSLGLLLYGGQSMERVQVGQVFIDL